MSRAQWPLLLVAVGLVVGGFYYFRPPFGPPLPTEQPTDIIESQFKAIHAALRKQDDKGTRLYGPF